MPLRDREDAPTVVVIDDDRAVREALEGLFASVGLSVDLFDSVDAYLEAAPDERPGCLVVDVRLPGKSGLDFIEEEARAGNRRAIVFISGHADIAMSVRAMKAGAIEFLTKPVREQELLDAVQRAIRHDRQQRAEQKKIAEARARYGLLTPRERAVMAQVVIGRLNRQIAEDIGITEATVKLHRGQIMRKMQVGSLIDLVRAADLLGD
ncbi:response regulator [Sphingomonas sp. AR_OL41]|uniref:response regulator transcription factor n=1 Tax=Sphingomonas sp. AR_OL41 TaxID=3042729 RepID=UPI002481594A|nr:response regulator [Sphingomonas sp. AR_OL41]MDH7972861.1 response regulator [Sphingomonas sp. AR_OL41]